MPRLIIRGAFSQPERGAKHPVVEPERGARHPVVVTDLAGNLLDTRVKLSGRGF